MGKLYTTNQNIILFALKTISVSSEQPSSYVAHFITFSDGLLRLYSSKRQQNNTHRFEQNAKIPLKLVAP